MKLVALLEAPDRKFHLAMQQDFIDTFPDDWHFDLAADGGLDVYRDSDDPCWQEARTFYNPHSDPISRGEYEEIIHDRFSSKMEQNDLPIVDVTLSGMELFKDSCEVDVQFKSYVDAFYTFILEEGGWENWDKEGRDGGFNAGHIYQFVKKHLNYGHK